MTYAPRGPDVFDWPGFATDVKRFMADNDLTVRGAAKRFGGSHSAWHRARAGQKLSVGNCLFIARTADLDPYDYSVFHGKLKLKHGFKQSLADAGDITGAPV